MLDLPALSAGPQGPITQLEWHCTAAEQGDNSTGWQRSVLQQQRPAGTASRLACDHRSHKVLDCKRGISETQPSHSGSAASASKAKPNNINGIPNNSMLGQYHKQSMSRT
ncbi:TPA: hypothetical protein ACH3X1_010030 [Trebouxia sp. C0004]